MKKTLFLLFLSLSTFLHAQNVLEIEPSYIEAHHENLDLSDEFLDVIHYLRYKNLTDDTLLIKWEYETTGECPEEWFYVASDNNNHYINGVTSNIFPDLGIDAPVILQPMDTTGYFEFWIRPKGKAGCCEITVHFSEVHQPDSILGTAIFDFRINNPTCSPTNTYEQLLLSVELFPNPASDFCILKFSDKTSVEKEIKLYDVFGKLLEQRMIIELQTEFDLSKFSSGIYYLSIDNREIIRFVKE